MGFASSSKISLLPLFDVIPRTFPFVVEIALHYPSVPAHPWRHRATSPEGVSRDPWPPSRCRWLKTERRYRGELRKICALPLRILI